MAVPAEQARQRPVGIFREVDLQCGGAMGSHVDQIPPLAYAAIHPFGHQLWIGGDTVRPFPERLQHQGCGGGLPGGKVAIKVGIMKARTFPGGDFHEHFERAEISGFHWFSMA